MRKWLMICSVLTLIYSAKAQDSKKSTETQYRSGVASFYHQKFEGRKTATGEVFDNDKFTAACNTLQLGTYVKVTNTTNGKVVYVKINDRMAPNNRRAIDLAKIAASELNFVGKGLTNVKIEVVSAEEGRQGILAQNERRKKRIEEG